MMSKIARTSLSVCIIKYKMLMLSCDENERGWPIGIFQYVRRKFYVQGHLLLFRRL